VIGLVFISAIAAALCVGLSVLALAINRLKGFLFTRWVALIATSAAAYSVIRVASLSGMSAGAQLQLNRWAVLFVALHASAWLAFSSRSAPEISAKIHRVLALLCFVGGLSALVPGWVYGDTPLNGHAAVIDWAVASPKITTFGACVSLLPFAVLAYTVVYLRVSKPRGAARWELTPSLAVFVICVALEAAYRVGWLHSPLTASIGFLVLVVAVVDMFSRDVLESYSKLLELSVKLEHDVDERNQELVTAQAALTRADRLAALGQLAAGVGHEINNPLTYVMTNLKELVENLPTAENSSERIQLAGLASEALDGTERIRRVVRDLRLLSRSREQDQLESIDIHHVLGDALKLAEHVLKHRARVQEDYGNVPRVKAESQRLAQVFVNLLVNAAQAIPESQPDRGTITVRTRLGSAGAAVIEISDDGLGIAPQHLARIFEPYFTTKTQGEGTGLGLFVSLGILRSFGGDIEVESEIGKGTTMRVSLPASESVELPEPSPSQDMPVTPRRARILVVDDDPVVARAMRRMLREHDVSIALDARHALNAFEQSESFDVVVCDLMMPDMSGADLYVEACDRWPELKNRFLFMTGGAVTPKAQALLQRNDTRCLVKPIQTEDLHAMVDSVVASVDRAQRSISSRPMW